MKKIISLVLTIALVLSMGKAVYAAPSKAKTLSDIKGNWAETSIKALFAKGIVTGNTAGKYEPKKTVTRAEFTALLIRAMGYKTVKSSSFTDINYNKYWAMPYIETAVAKGIIIPEEVGELFYGDVPLKRSDMAMMMTRALKLEQSTGENPFYDLQEANGYFTKLYDEYLIRGTIESGKTLFKSNGLTTKAEAATVVARVLEYKANPATFKEKMKVEVEKVQAEKDLQEQRKQKAAAAGVSVDLFNNTSNLKEFSIEDTNQEVYKQLNFPMYGWETKGNAEENVAYMVQLAKDYMKIEGNIDYRTVLKTYEEQIKNLTMHDYTKYGKNKKTATIYANNKVVMESQFFTSNDLILYTVGFNVRGTLRFRVLEPTSKDFMTYYYLLYDQKPLAYGTWYERDIEVTIGGSYDEADKLLKYRVVKYQDISTVRLSKQ